MCLCLRTKTEINHKKENKKYNGSQLPKTWSLSLILKRRSKHLDFFCDHHSFRFGGPSHYSNVLHTFSVYFRFTCPIFFLFRKDELNRSDNFYGLGKIIIL